MSFLNIKDLSKHKEREKIWEHLFNKYENSQEEEGDLTVEEIVEAFGKTRVTRSRTQKLNNSVAVIKNKSRNETLVLSNIGPKTKLKSYTPEESKVLFIKQEDGWEITETSSKRGRPRKNIKIEVEETDTSPRKRGRPKLQFRIKPETNIKMEYGEPSVKVEIEEKGKTSIRGRPPKKTEINDTLEINKQIGRRGRPCLNKTVKLEPEFETEINDTPEINKKIGRRGRPCLNKTVKLEPEINDTPEINKKIGRRGRPCLNKTVKLEPEFETFIENGKENQPRKRGRPKKNTEGLSQTYNLKTESSKPTKKKLASKSFSSTYEKYLVHSSCKKELKREFSYLCFDKKNLSKSFTETPNLNKTSRRSRSCNDYSEKSLRVMVLFENYNVLKTEKEEREKRQILTPLQPFNKTTGKIYKKKDKSSDNTEGLDLELLKTKYIIEEELKSNLGLLLIQRCKNLQLNIEGKENNFNFFQNAVKSELIKLHKTISMEQLQQYMEWYVTAWKGTASKWRILPKNV